MALDLFERVFLGFLLAVNGPDLVRPHVERLGIHKADDAPLHP